MKQKAKKFDLIFSKKSFKINDTLENAMFEKKKFNSSGVIVITV